MENKVNVNVENVDKQFEEQFTKGVVRAGRLWNLVGVLLSFLPALYIAIRYDTFPGFQSILKGWGLVVAIFGAYYIVEPVSYFPVLGVPGTMMGFISGNLGNMRVPCSAIAQDAVGVIPGTKKAELVSTLGIAGSIITNLLFTLLAAVAGSYIMSILPQSVLNAFTYIAPSIFGSMYAMFAIKDLRLGGFALVVTLIMIWLKLPVYVMVPGAVFSTIIFGLTLNKKGKGGAQSEA